MQIVRGIAREEGGMLYTVSVDGRECWRKWVRFGMTARSRAGGGNFVDAAREQDALAEKLLAEYLQRKS
jgi:hypothetical protein